MRMRRSLTKMTGHRSRELRKYQHPSPEFKRQTVEKIAQKLTGTVSVSELFSVAPHGAKLLKINGGADGIRTRDLRRDRMKLPDHEYY